jgi:hypothetical protein
MDLLGPPRVDPIYQSPRTRTYRYFTHGTDPPSPPFLIWFLLSSRSSSSAAFPNPFRCRLLGHRLSPASGTTQQSDYGQSTASHFAYAYRVTSSRATEDSASPPEVTRHSSVPCRPQSPCFWWVHENAFASLQQARPYPTFGRPVHLRGGAPRLRPGTSPHALRIPPHGGHPALRELQSGGFRSALAVSNFRLRARLGFSIPSPLPGRRGVIPAFGYGAPHSSAGGT